MNRAIRLGLMSACLALAAAGAASAGVIRCWIDHGAVVVPAAYGPISGDFILDLSQAKSQLHNTAAQAAGWTDDIVRATFRLAGRTRLGFEMPVVDLDSRVADFPTNIAGVLGADALGPFMLDVDFSPCRLRLSRAPPFHRAGLRRLETRVVAGVPLVAAAVSDGVTARTGWFAIDTASTASRIAAAAFSRLLPKGADASGRAGAPARLRAVSLAGALFEQMPAGLMRPVTPGLAGSLGTAVWSRLHLRAEPRSGDTWWVAVAARPVP